MFMARLFFDTIFSGVGVSTGCQNQHCAVYPEYLYLQTGYIFELKNPEL